MTGEDQQSYQHSFGSYEVIQELGTNATSRTFLVKKANADSEELLTLKWFHTLILDTSLQEEQFQADVKRQQQIQHPYILPIVNAGLDQGYPYVVREYFPHGSLADQLRQKPDLLTEERALDMLTSIGLALDYLHEHGVLHGNLNPHNILFNASGSIVLTDMVLPSLMDSGLVEPVTPFTAPEKARKTLTQASDQYSLAVLAYILFYRKPSPRTGPIIPQLEALSSTLAQAIKPALAQNPQERYPNIRTLLTQLQKKTRVTRPIRGISGPLTPLPVVFEESPANPTDPTVAIQAPVQPEPSQRLVPIQPKAMPPKPKRSRFMFSLTLAFIILILFTTIFFFYFTPTDLPQVLLNNDPTNNALSTSPALMMTEVISGTPTATIPTPGNTPGTTATAKQQTPTTTTQQSGGGSTPTPTPTNTPTPTPTAVIADVSNWSVTPANLNLSNCPVANGYPTCVITIKNQTNLQQAVGWSFYLNGLIGTVSQSNGTLSTGQSTTITLSMQDVCPNTDTLIFQTETNVTKKLYWAC